MSDCTNCVSDCASECVDENKVVISLDGAPAEIVSLVNAVAKVAVDYPLAISGSRKRSTEVRKSLMDIKKLALEMRKLALDKCKAAKEGAAE